MEIIDDKFTVIKDDIDRVQKNPTLYISFVGKRAVEQLCYECTNNMIDEHESENSISNGEMSIFIDSETGEITFQDNGRGIEFDQMENACTVLQAGTKMERAYSKKSGGENGVGLTTTNALSELFEMLSIRNGKARFIRFRNGRLIEEREYDVEDKTKHGLQVGFIPSKYFLGEDAELPIESFMEWLEKQSYLLEPKIKIKLTVSGMPGTAIDKTVIYQNTEGIKGFLKRFEPNANLLPKPIILSGTVDKIKETVPVLVEGDGTKDFVMTDMLRYITIEFSFNYNPMSDVQKVYAFTNNIENVQGGEHVRAVTSALTSYFVRAANETKSPGKKKKHEVTSNDVLSGMCLLVSLTTNLSTRFENQTKHKLGNKDFYEPIRKLASQAISDWGKLSENKTTLNRIISFLKTIASIRAAATKTRSSIKTSTSFLDSKLITRYTPANFINKTKEEREKMGDVKLCVYFCEGDSAGGGLRNGRYNNDIQGVLNLRGVPDNIYKKELEILRNNAKSENSLWRQLFDEILGCGYGKHFNIENLKYDYIYFVPDADIDGDHIAALLLAGFIKCAPQLILQGHVYRVIPPLYRISPYGNKFNKNSVNKANYVYNKKEIYEVFADTLATRLFLKPAIHPYPEDCKSISQKEKREFVLRNCAYLNILRMIQDRYRLDYDVIEFIAENKDFAERIGEFDSELVYRPEDETISGSHNKKHCFILLNDIFMKQIEKLRDILKENNWQLFYHCYEGEDKKYKGIMSIGYIMESMQKYYPKIISRFKGLGEMNESEIQELIMNPNNHKALQFVIDDIEEVKRNFDVLFLDSTTDERKKIIDSMSISLEDIDN